MTYTPAAYDPFGHLRRLGLTVIHRPLSVNGYWVHERRAILLNTSLKAWHERQVCAHEIGHAVLGHRACRLDEDTREERQANRWAARKLLTLTMVEQVARTSPDPGVWALELGVTDDFLELWLSDNRRDLESIYRPAEHSAQLEWA